MRLGNAELEGSGTLMQSAYYLVAGEARQPPFGDLASQKRNAAIDFQSNKDVKNWVWGRLLLVCFFLVQPSFLGIRQRCPDGSEGGSSHWHLPRSRGSGWYCKHCQLCASLSTWEKEQKQLNLRTRFIFRFISRFFGILCMAKNILIIYFE